MNWFSISTAVVDRDDLNIYEKMCYVVLARKFQDETMDDFTMVELSKLMGVEEIVAKGAFYALRTKGILVSMDSDVKPGMIIKADQTQELTESIPASKDAGLSYDAKVLKVFEIIDEKINEREARIILNFANNDLERIAEKYKVAKASQYQDKIEVLIHELQKKQQGRIIKKEAVAEQVKSFDDFAETEDVQETQVNDDFPEAEDVQKTQVNTYKLNQMRKYKKKDN